MGRFNGTKGLKSIVSIRYNQWTLGLLSYFMLFVLFWPNR